MTEQHAIAYIINNSLSTIAGVRDVKEATSAANTA